MRLPPQVNGVSSSKQLPFAVLIGAGAILLSWPAVHNGYPLVYPDTGTYLRQGLELYGAEDRPPYYGLLILPLHLGLTLWTIPFAQAALVAWLLLKTVDTYLPGLGRDRAMPLILALAAGSTLPWHTAQVMPDIFTGVMFLSLVLLSSAALAWGRERFLLLILLSVALAVHLTHWVIAVFVLVGLWIFSRGRSFALPTYYFSQTAASILLSLLAFNAYSLAKVKSMGVSPTGPVFLLARSLEDGPARAWLRENCPRTDIVLCGDLARMPRTSDEFLWRSDSPLGTLYRKKGLLGGAEEARVILSGTVREHFWWQLSASVRNLGLQLVRFAPGDFVADYRNMNMSVTRTLRTHFRDELASFLSSRQVKGTLPVRTAGAITIPLAVLAFIVGLAQFMGLGPQPSSAAKRLFVLTLVAIGANALITGACAGPFHRYGSRVIWLLPLAALVTALSGRFGDGQSSSGSRPS